MRSAGREAGAASGRWWERCCVAALAAAALLAGAAVAGGARLQVFFAADFKDQDYQQVVYKRAGAAWRQPAAHPKAGSKSVVMATILRDGTAPGPRLHHPSGSKAWDDAALAAVGRAQPFGPLPKGYAPSSVEVHFHFEYSG
ncbi:MAG: energy transducer TonB [Candidatus Polarisedimenticolia bacterium]